MFALDCKASGRRRWLAQVTGLIVAGMHGSALSAASRRSPQIPSEPRSSATDFNQVISRALDGRAWEPSDAVRLEVPQLAENGAIVPITVESRLPNTRRILIFAEKNPGPLLAEFLLEPGADPWVSLRVKLNESGPLLAVIESNSNYYGSQTTVKVMLGGCG